ncbi:fibromodulin [Halictus rubicundus]|uniref:fibromodulin n=1 Tax=Halictus rubicundus TaxID=77578 RepID=UPI004036F400
MTNAPKTILSSPVFVSDYQARYTLVNILLEKGRHLYSVDTGITNNVQALDLSDNVVSSLNAFELVNVGLANLKYLNLSTNAVSEIDMYAFHGLVNLTVLDLTKNYLHSIPDDAFELSLDFCQISHLPSDTFNGLPRLRRLNLANNLMIQMSRSVVQTLTSLQKISLEGYGKKDICNDVHLKI